MLPLTEFPITHDNGRKCQVFEFDIEQSNYYEVEKWIKTTSFEVEYGPPIKLTVFEPRCAPRPFKKVDIVSDWGSFNALNKIKLEPGDFVDVKWPDGSVSGHAVYFRVEQHKGPNTNYDTSTSRAYVLVQHNGAEAEVLLFNILAKFRESL